MTYIPLHHKYRPQTFAELVGQSAIATTLINALRQQKIAPAYLFTGARGTGKTSSARILAKSLNCLRYEAPTETPCGECDVCRSIALGAALDVIEIDAASNTGVDNIRELIERAQFAPVQCRYKVYAIDECHMLSTAAFNALLKTLEEPPDRVVFVLATTDPQRVLPTIISRCQRFDYRRIPLDDMVPHLRMIADKEAIVITDEAITLIGQISQGGLRDAESLLDQVSLLAGDVTVDRVWDLVGAVPERDLLGMLMAIAADNPEALLDHARNLLDRGREPIVVLQNLASFYRDLLIAKTAPARGDLVALTPSTWTALCEFAQSISLPTILSGQQHLRSSEAQLKNTTQPRLWLEVTLMGLLPSAVAIAPAHPPASPPPRTSAPPTLAPRSQSSPKVAATSQPVEPAIAPIVASSAAEPAEPADTSPTSPPAAPPNLNTFWQQVLKQVQPVSTQILLRQQGCLVQMTDEAATIGVVDKWYKAVKTKVSNLESAFAHCCDRPIQIRIEILSPDQIKTIQEGASPTSGSESWPSASAAIAEPPTPSNQPSGTTPPSAINSDPTIELEPPSPSPEPSEDEASQAAQSLANFFGGRIVSLDDEQGPQPNAPDIAEVPDAATEPDTIAWPEEDNPDEDIPF